MQIDQDTPSTSPQAANDDRARKAEELLRLWNRQTGGPLSCGPPGQREAALRLLRQGLPFHRVARKLRLAPSVVRIWRDAEGLAPPPRSVPSPEREQGEALLRSGMSVTEVARTVGRSVSAVSRWRSALGLPPLCGWP